MPHREPVCPSCKQPMQRGFVLDANHSGQLAGRWAEGEPKRSFWGVRVKGRKVREIAAFRCERCGRLELFAD